MNNKRPKVGAGALIVKNNKVFLAKRKGSHGEGMWGSMGGHVEFGEKPADTVVREAKEELGIDIKVIKFLCCTHFIVDSKHYIDLGFLAEVKKGTPKIQPEEVGKISEIKWFNIDNIPSPMFPPVKMYLESYKSGKNYFELE